MSFMQEAREFQRLYELPSGTPDSMRTQVKNIKEEYLELRIALKEYEEAPERLLKTRAEDALKEMGDEVYTLYQLAVERGWDLDEALRRIHASNLSKLDENGRPIRNEYGKVLKGPNYVPPDLSDLV